MQLLGNREISGVEYQGGTLVDAGQSPAGRSDGRVFGASHVPPGIDMDRLTRDIPRLEYHSEGWPNLIRLPETAKREFAWRQRAKACAIFVSMNAGAIALAVIRYGRRYDA